MLLGDYFLLGSPEFQSYQIKPTVKVCIYNPLHVLLVSQWRSGSNFPLKAQRTQIPTCYVVCETASVVLLFIATHSSNRSFPNGSQSSRAH